MHKEVFSQSQGTLFLMIQLWHGSMALSLKMCIVSTKKTVQTVFRSVMISILTPLHQMKMNC